MSKTLINKRPTNAHLLGKLFIQKRPSNCVSSTQVRRRCPSEVPAREAQEPRHTDAWTRTDKRRASLRRRPALSSGWNGCWHTRRWPATARCYVLALPQIGLPPRHLSSACGHEGRQRRRLGQPCNRLCKLCARAVMRHFATRGQLEFVCPWSLVPFVRSQGQAPPDPGEHCHRVLRGAEAVLHC